jgi:phosphoribosylanthranilate isomerase
MPRIAPDMPAPQRQIKLCGMTLPQDVDAAISVGATHIGLILAAQSPRALTVKEATRLSDQIARLPSPRLGVPVKRVGVFMDQPMANVQAMAQTIGLDIIQLHGRETPTYCQALAARWPVIKAFNVTDASTDLAQIEDYLPHIQLALLDRPKAAGDDWLNWHRNLAQHVEHLPHTVPWWLAGGLTPENLTQVWGLYQNLPVDGTRLRSHLNPPHGFDVASGIEQQPGIKDNAKLRQFVKQALAL